MSMEISIHQMPAGTSVLTGGVGGIMQAVAAGGMLIEELPGEHAASVAAPHKDAAVAAPAPTQEFQMEFPRPNGEIFYARKIKWGDQETTDVQLLRDWVAAGLYPFLVGDPGTGKTGLIEAAFWDWSGSNGLITMVGTSSTEPSDFVGGYVPLPDGTFRWVDGPQAVAMEEGKVLYVDEIGRIDPKVLPVVYPVMDGRDTITTDNPARGLITAKPGFHVVASTNPKAPGCIMDDALLSRFAPPIEYTTDFAIAVRNLGVPVEVAAMARDMTKAVVSGTAYWAPTMRDLLQFKMIAMVSGQMAAWHGLLTAAPVEARPEVATKITDVTGHVLSPRGWEI